MGLHSEMIAKLALSRMAKTDPVPYDPRTGEEYELLRVNIVCTTHNQVIPNGQRVELGEAAYEVYSNQMPSVMALVETATKEDLAQVQRDYERHLRECSGEDGKARNERHYWPSFEASFRRVLGRDRKPFASVEVLKAPRSKSAAG